MPTGSITKRSICPCYLRAQSLQHRQCRIAITNNPYQTRGFLPSPPLASAEDGSSRPNPSPPGGHQEETKKDGAMSRRLSQMTEDMLETGGRRAIKAVQEAGFDETLRKQLEERIADASFRSENATAIAQAQLPSSAGKGTRDIAGAKPWTGEETVEDAALRMLTDAHMPLKTKPRIPSVRGLPPRVDTGRPAKGAQGSGTRLANARDKSSVYSMMKETGMSEAEREQFMKEMKARFQPASREMPATLQGLASLANERIEDAIARGQFKNLPRGRKIERDHNASSPFIDTTEYLMNKIIQKQEIVPPWIEKQKELVSTVTKFRARLRSDWKRHAAMMIASKGGTLEEQVNRAREYAEAEAEALEKPPRKKEEKIHAVVDDGHLSQITLSGELKVTSDITVTPREKIDITENPSLSGSLSPSSSEAAAVGAIDPSSAPTLTSRRPPFRDPAWETTERAYHNLTIDNLNALTRSYNLIAPTIAQKPYYSLARELRNCYADVAPLLPNEILERARIPKTRLEIGISKPTGGRLENVGIGNARVYDENSEKKGYGLKEFWKDLWRME